MTVFASDLTQLQEKFIECGPSSVGSDLDKGEFIYLSKSQVYKRTNCPQALVSATDVDTVSSIHIWRENFSHSAYVKSEAKMADIDVKIEVKTQSFAHTTRLCI